MKRFFKTLFYIIVIALILVQFYPKPKKNISASTPSSDITFTHQVPADVLQVLKTSCYDCHSNNTVYPWYASVQPVAYWLGDHIEEGKSELNFSEYGNYAIRRQYRKLEEISKQVKEAEMPLASYTIVHRDATLNEAQKLLVTNWVTILRDSMAGVYPPDSLTKKKS